MNSISRRLDRLESRLKGHLPSSPSATRTANETDEDIEQRIWDFIKAEEFDKVDALVGTLSTETLRRTVAEIKTLHCAVALNKEGRHEEAESLFRTLPEKWIFRAAEEARLETGELKC